MIERHAGRKIVEEDRIAICPKFGCKHLEKVKPLKFGILGFRKYPKCSKHKLHLVFVDEFIENFIRAINACLFDISGLPPESLLKLIKEKIPDDLKVVIDGWMYCNSIGRGAQIVSNYMDGLSKSYMKLLNRKQRRSLQDENNSKKRHQMLRLGLKKIAEEYTNFLQNLREKSEQFDDCREYFPLSDNARTLIKAWLKTNLDKIHISKKRSDFFLQNNSLSMIKMEYDKILHVGTCTLILGKSPAIITKGLSAFELFSAYHNFLNAGLCKELKKDDVKVLLVEIDPIATKYKKPYTTPEEQKINVLAKNFDGLLINEDIIELIGIILGDGNIQVYPDRWRYRLIITLNGVDESRYVEYVKMLLTRVFGVKPKVDNTIKGKGLLLAYYSKKIVQSIVELGLHPGRKTLNQVSVPRIVLDNLKFYKYCLKGLFDTDGSIEINKNKNFILAFSNMSAPLAKDFYEMCKALDIFPSPKIGRKKRKDGAIENTVSIAKKDEVKKFLNIIKPEKIKEPYRRLWLGTKCIIFSSAMDIQQKINNHISAIKDELDRKTFQYSNENALLLKSITEKILGIEITQELVNSSISSAIEPTKHMYNMKRARRLKYLYEKIRSPTRIIEYLIDQGELIVPGRTTIAKQLKRYFREIDEDINNWKENFPSLSIYLDNGLNHITRFPVEKRDILIKIIIEILKKYQNDLTHSKLIKILEQRFIESEKVLMDWLVRSPKYGRAFDNYLKLLSKLLRQLVNISNNNLELNIAQISSDFSYTNLKNIIWFIRKNKLLEFKIPPNSKHKSL